MSSKDVIQKYKDGFRRGDHTAILSCLTDDITWDIPGFVFLQGKEAFDREKWCIVGKPTITILRMIEENDGVVAEGLVQSNFKNGNLLDAAFCDLFHFEYGKIKKVFLPDGTKQKINACAIRHFSW